MFKNVVRTFMVPIIGLVFMLPACQAFAAGADLTPTAAPPSSRSAAAPSGVTGTDPEPIEPSVLELMFAVLAVS